MFHIKVILILDKDSPIKNNTQFLYMMSFIEDKTQPGRMWKMPFSF